MITLYPFHFQMMMHEIKSDQDSDIITLSPGHSSTTSTKHPIYFVQSPDSSHDDNGSRILSGHLSPGPVSSSPSDSPRHFYTGRPSSTPRSSSSSASNRSSESWRYLRINRKRPWPTSEFPVIAEDDDDDHAFTLGRDIPMPPYVGPVIAFSMTLIAFCLITWSVGRVYKPQITVQSLKVNRLLIGGSSDNTGVPSKFITINCTAVISVRNPATFFGIHITSQTADVTFFEIRVATGYLKGHYYLTRTSNGNITMELYGSEVPLYGAGATLREGRKIPLKLDMELQSRGYMIGWLVKTTHRKHITCSFAYSRDSNEVNFQDSNEVNLRRHSCTYE